jgi:hypothetical protein
MPPEIRWKTSLSATCLHAAACWRQGVPAADAHLAAVIDEPAAALIREIADAGWSVDETLAQLASLSAEYENNRELVTRALARLRLGALAGGPAANRVAGAIADLEAALHRAQPQLVEEMAVRGGPIREQWEALGPGMFVEVARLTDAAVVPESAEVVLVAPYAGGHGLAHPAQNRLTLEAVLVNPLPELPEVARVAWLLCQLNSDLPRFADVLPFGRVASTFRVALLPAVLAAGEAVELIHGGESALDLALDAWRLRQNLPPDAATRLQQWWSVWLDHPSRWEIAVAALDGMLG